MLVPGIASASHVLEYAKICRLLPPMTQGLALQCTLQTQHAEPSSQDRLTAGFSFLSLQCALQYEDWVPIATLGLRQLCAGSACSRPRAMPKLICLAHGACMGHKGCFCGARNGAWACQTLTCNVAGHQVVPHIEPELEVPGALAQVDLPTPQVQAVLHVLVPDGRQVR